MEWNIGPNKVWKNVIENKLVIELNSYTFDLGRGMSIGKYNKNI